MNKLLKFVFGVVLTTILCVSIERESAIFAEDIFDAGVVVTPYNNGGKAYDNWWGESEICAYVENVSIPITRGGYGVTAYVQDYQLKDGDYGVEVSLCRERSPYTFFSYTGTSFTVKNGVITSHDDQAAYRRTEMGYLIDFASGYCVENAIEKYVLVLKVHTSVTESNGNIFFGELFLADRFTGFQFVNFLDKKLVFSAERLTTEEKQTISVKKMKNQVVIKNITNLLYTGKTYQLSVQKGTKETIKYKSSDKSIAKISSTGKITALKPGKTKITVTNGSGNSYSWELEVKDPYISFVTERSRVLVGTTYVYKAVANGYKAGTVTWKSSNKTVGTINAKTGVFVAKKAGTTKITATDSAGYSHTLKVQVFDDGNTDIAKYIIVHESDDASAELQELIYEHLLKVYKNVYAMFGDGTYHYIDLYFEHIDFAAAYATIGYSEDHNEIHIGIETMTSNINDVDCATHELIHTAQNYPFETSNGEDRGWLGEGLTDYGRYLLGVQNDKAGWSLGKYEQGQEYTDSYRTTASFIKYVVDVHDAAFAQELNEALRNHTYTDNLWKKSTGYTIDQLWEMYKKW